jgi:hypothetical protein
MLNIATLTLIGVLNATTGLPAWQAPQPVVPGTLASEPGGPSTRLRVFLDCNCFADYLRSEILWVDFVRQRQDADVHLLSATNDTGGAGLEYVLRFVGVGRFQGVDLELRARTVNADPEETRRRAVFRAITVGFLGFIARDGLPPDLGVTVRPPAASPGGAAPARDPWRAWVFSMRGGGSINAEETNRQISWNGRAGADRVTERWIVSFGASVEEETEHFDLDEDAPLKVVRNSSSADWFLAKSLGPRWSFGLDGDLDSSTFGNTKLSVTTAPAIEFNLFPYSEYASRQFRLHYGAGVAHARYNEVTLFGKLRETVGRHQASATLEQKQPWGTLEAGVDWTQYLHDRSKYRLEINGDMSLRLARGLSLNLEGSAARIRDQLSLPLRGATSEEVLLRLREIQSGYEVDFSANLTYTFGSIFNAVVNPRFGR